MGRCRFETAYHGICRRQAVSGRMCAEHAEFGCCSCGRAATHACPVKIEETKFGRVCLEPLCSRCVHFDDGHGVLPDDPTPEGMARDLTRTVLEREPPPTRTVVQDLTALLEELR